MIAGGCAPNTDDFRKSPRKQGVKVLVIATDGFGGHGGIALYTRNVLTALCAHPSRPEVLAIPRVVPFDVGALPAGLTWDMSAVGGKMRYVRAAARAALQSWDLILCMHIHLLPIAFAIHKMHRAPLAMFVYGIETKKPTTKPLSNRLVGKIDALVTIRARTARSLRMWAVMDSVPQFQLENAIRLNEYGVAQKSEALVERYRLAGKTVVLTMGRVEEPYKGFDEVLEALPLVAKHIPNITYVVAGGGPDIPRLREKAKALGVADRVVYTGLVSDAEKADHYRLADVFAMPGRGPEFDRYPLRFVFLEAMACGVPVVGSTVEDEAERRNEGALLAAQVDPNDLEDIARGIVTALGQRERKVPSELSKYAFPEFQRRLHAIVDSLVGGTARASAAE